MKTFLKIIVAIIILIVAALFIIPIVFEDDIVKLVKEETNKNVNAKVDFGNFSLSLIKSFPDFYLSVEDIKVEGVDEFEGVKMAEVGELDVVIDLMSVINGESIQLKKIIIIKPNIHLKVLADGKANWDIAKVDSSAVTEEVTSEEASTFKMDLQEFRVEDGIFFYEDVSMPMSMGMNDMDVNLSGDMTASQTNLKVDGSIADVDFNFDGVAYLKDAVVLLNAGIGMDLDAFKFTFLENTLRVNELPLAFDGWLAMPNDAIDMDITFGASQTDFKDILSMVPAEFAKDLEGVKTAGTLALDGYVKGTYIDSTYPAFATNLVVENGMFQYPDLPKSVKDINVIAKIESIDGDLDHTIVDVSKFFFVMAEAPFNMSFYMSEPISDPFIRAAVQGSINVDNVKDVIPLPEGDELAGVFNAQLSLEGRLSTLEKEEYESFKAMGNLEVKNFHYASDSLDYPVDMKSAKLLFTPKYAELSNMNMQLGKSDISAEGRLENFIGYALSDKAVLHGVLNLSSNMMDINELAGIDPAAETEEDAEETPETAEEAMEVVVLPKNIDFTTTASIQQLIFDDLSIQNINGSIVLKDEKLSLKNTNMNLLEGSMKMSGFYETTDSLRPTFDFVMDIEDFDVQKTSEKFNSVQKLAPIVKHSKGKYSTDLSIVGTFDSAMNPVYESLNGKGKLLTKGIKVEGFKPLEKVAKTIKYEKLSPLEVNDVYIDFTIVDGKVIVEPFDVKVGDSKMTVSGYSSIDQSINYKFDFEIPRKEFGGQANSVVDGLLSQASAKGVNVKIAETIKIGARMTGTFDDPKVAADFSSGDGDSKKSAKDQVKEQVKEKVKEVIDEKKDELEKKAKEEAEKQKKELEAKAKEELEKKKKEAQKKLEEEAKKKLKGLFK